MRRYLSKEGKAELFHIFYMQALTYDQGIIEHGGHGLVDWSKENKVALQCIEKRLHTNWYRKNARKQVQDIERGIADYDGRMAEEIWAAMVENSLTSKRTYSLQLFGWGIRVW